MVTPFVINALGIEKDAKIVADGGKTPPGGKNYMPFNRV
jgi:hypothetical protein